MLRFQELYSAFELFMAVR